MSHSTSVSSAPQAEPINHNLACAIYRHYRERPDAVAVVSKDVSISYRELAERAARLAAGLRLCRGWQRQESTDGQPPRVGILASRGIGACVAVLGACWAGATYIPIGLKQPEERTLALLAQCSLSAIVTDDEGLKLLTKQMLDAFPLPVFHAGQTLASMGSHKAMLTNLNELPPLVPPQPMFMGAADTAYVIFTSGTTGVPKGVVISAGAARHYIASITDYLGLRASDRALETCELGFDFSVHNMFSTWEAGAQLHILPATTVMNAVKFVRNAGVTVWNSVPSLAGMLRQLKALPPDSLATLRLTVFGGEQLPSSTVSAWRAAAPNSAIVNLYGPTEATVFCLAQPVGHSVPVPVSQGRDVVAIGTPLPGNRAAVLGEDGHFLPDGEPGELVIGGIQLADGYLGAAALTVARFPMLAGGRWYRTGDLALRDHSGHFHCLGRIDNQVKVLGYRVELEEIDAHLRVASGADVVGTVAWPMVDGVARGVVCFVGAPALDVDLILKALRERVPPYMVPNQLIALEHMPLNTSGKVDRRALRQWLQAQVS